MRKSNLSRALGDSILRQFRERLFDVGVGGVGVAPVQLFVTVRDGDAPDTVER